MKNEKTLVVCVWCNKVLVYVKSPVRVSHGICKECKREVLNNATSKYKQDNSSS